MSLFLTFCPTFRFLLFSSIILLLLCKHFFKKTWLRTCPSISRIYSSFVLPQRSLKINKLLVHSDIRVSSLVNPRIYFSTSFERKPVINRISQRKNYSCDFYAHRYHPSFLDCRAAGRIDRRKGRHAFDTLTVTLSQLFPARAFAALPSLVPSFKSRRLPRMPPCPECIMVHV